MKKLRVGVLFGGRSGEHDVSLRSAASILGEINRAKYAVVPIGITRNGKIYLNEINTVPGFTSMSIYPKLWEASGIPFTKLIDRLIRLGMERYTEKKKNEIILPRGLTMHISTC